MAGYWTGECKPRLRGHALDLAALAAIPCLDDIIAFPDDVVVLPEDVYAFPYAVFARLGDDHGSSCIILRSVRRDLAIHLLLSLLSGEN